VFGELLSGACSVRGSRPHVLDSSVSGRSLGLMRCWTVREWVCLGVWGWGEWWGGCRFWLFFFGGGCALRVRRSFRFGIILRCWAGFGWSASGLGRSVAVKSRFLVYVWVRDCVYAAGWWVIL